MVWGTNVARPEFVSIELEYYVRRAYLLCKPVTGSIYIYDEFREGFIALSMMSRDEVLHYSPPVRLIWFELKPR